MQRFPKLITGAILSNKLSAKHSIFPFFILVTLIFNTLLVEVKAQGFVDNSILSGVITEDIATFGSPIWTDFDNDGTLDVFVINHGGTPTILQNNLQFVFTDIFSTSGISSAGDRHGAAWGDYDNDGDKDLFITLGGGGSGGTKSIPDQLYRNDGLGIFYDIAVEAGVTNDFGRGRSVNWIDFDNDGLLDVFLNNLKSDNLLLKNNGDNTFTDVALLAGVVDDTGIKSAWSDYDKDGDVDFFTTSDRDQLWQNNGDGTFIEVTEAAGIANEKFGQSVAWGDFNNDGYNDIFVARGFNDSMGGLIQESKLLGFNATISSADASLEAGIDFKASGELTFDLYAINCREINNTFLGENNIVPDSIPFTIKARDARNKPVFISGVDFGFFIWRDMSGWHIRWSYDGVGKSPEFLGKITTTGSFSAVEVVNFKPKVNELVNTLYMNDGDGTFTDVTLSAGVIGGSNDRSANWGDYDNDGDLDLYVVNSGDFLSNGKNTLYDNRGDGTFKNVARQKRVQALVNGRGEGASWADYNNDGLLDLYITNGAQKPVISQISTDSCLVHGPHILFENEDGSGNEWLKINLEGTDSNRDGIGAKIYLTSSSTSQYQEYIGSAAGFFSQGSSPVHFGLGSDNLVNELRVEWPSGITQILNDIPSNQHITIVESN